MESLFTTGLSRISFISGELGTSFVKAIPVYRGVVHLSEEEIVQELIQTKIHDLVGVLLR